MEVVTIKEEVDLHEQYLLEDDIKVEETCLQDSNGDVLSTIGASIDGQKFLVCSRCNSEVNCLRSSECVKCTLRSKTSVGSTNQDSFAYRIIPTSLVIRRKLSVCSTCKCAYERKACIKPQHKLDTTKCYKCILHSRLSQVFNGNYRRKNKSPEENTSPSDTVAVNNNPNHDSAHQTQSISVTKIMYVCVTCHAHFDRKDPTGLKHPSDWYKCNKCILHARLNTVFRPRQHKTRKT